MNTESSVTETVVRNHLQAFLEQKGVAAIVHDYDENARLYSEAKVYQGKQEISSRTSSTHCPPVPSSSSHSGACKSTGALPTSRGA